MRLTEAPSSSGAKTPEGFPRGADRKGSEGVNNAYFESYSYIDIHREMLSDKVRTPSKSTLLSYPTDTRQNPWGDALEPQQTLRDAWNQLALSVCVNAPGCVSPLLTNGEWGTADK